jgi:hypothetical protein
MMDPLDALKLLDTTLARLLEDIATWDPKKRTPSTLDHWLSAADRVQRLRERETERLNTRSQGDVTTLARLWEPKKWSPSARLPVAVQAALDEEAVALMSDLDDAIAEAANGDWSARCEWITTRIVDLALVGATFPELADTSLTATQWAKVQMRVNNAIAKGDWDRVTPILDELGE